MSFAGKPSSDWRGREVPLVILATSRDGVGRCSSLGNLYPCIVSLRCCFEELHQSESDAHVTCPPPPQPTPDQTHVQLAVNNPDMTEKVATQPVLLRRYRGTPFNELWANGYFEPETAMQAFRKTMTTHYSHGFPASPANEWLGLGGTVDVAFHGGVCVRPRQGKRVGRWYDITSETGAVRLQTDCITTSLIEVDGGSAG